MLLLSASFIDKAFKYEGIVYFWKTTRNVENEDSRYFLKCQKYIFFVDYENESNLIGILDAKFVCL